MEDESIRQGIESAPVDNTKPVATSMLLEGFGQPPLILNTVLSARDIMALSDYMHAIVAAEREACATICDEWNDATAAYLAAEIRSRT